MQVPHELRIVPFLANSNLRPTTTLWHCICKTSGYCMHTDWHCCRCAAFLLQQDAYYQDIRLAYQKLREECGAECDVMLLGYSLGALTALRLVKDCPNDTYAGVLCICPITEPLSWSLSELSELSRESQLSVMIMYSRLDVVSYPWDVETRLIQPLKSNQRLEVTDVQLQAGLHTTVLAATLFRFSRFPAWLRRLTKDRLEIGVVLALFALVEAVLLARVWEVMPVFPGALGTHVAATLAVGVGMEASIMIFAWRGIDATIFDVDRWLDAFVTGIYRQGIETEF